MSRATPDSTIPRIALTPSEAAQSAGVSETLLRDAKANGDLAVCIVGNGTKRRKWVVLPADLDAWLRRHRRAAKSEAER